MNDAGSAGLLPANSAAGDDVKPPRADGWCYTDCKEIPFTFVWTVRSFSLCQRKAGECLISSPFTVGGQNKSRWHLELYPNGYTEENSGFVALYLTLEEIQGDQESVYVTSSSFAIVDSAGCKFDERNDTEGQHFIKEETSGDDCFIERSVLQAKASQLLPNDQLTLHCTLTIVDEFVTTPASDGKTNSVHLNSKETPNNKPCNSDLELSQEMLRFIKTLKTNSKLTEANRAPDSKTMSRQSLEDPKMDTVIDILVDQYRARKRFKETVIDFVVKNFTEIKRTNSWKKALAQHPRVIIEIFDVVASKLCPPFNTSD